MGIKSYKVAKISKRAITKNQKHNAKPPHHPHLNKTPNPKPTPPKNPPTKTKTPLPQTPNPNPNPLKNLQHSAPAFKPR